MAKSDKPEVDPRVTKRRVTMKSVTAAPDGKTYEITRTDYVPDDERGLLEPFVAWARANWQVVDVSDEFDAGPGGYDGQTAVPGDLNHAQAGQVFAATKGN